MAFDPTKRPETSLLTDQKIKSLSGIEQWWHEVLQTGEFTTSDHDKPPIVIELGRTDSVFIATLRLKRGYETFAKAHNLRDRSFTEKNLMDRLQKLCGPLQYKRTKQDEAQARGYLIPALPAARLAFETYIGGTLEWPL